MGNIDEKILEIINNEESKLQNISDGQVKIGNRYYEFEERVFYDDNVKLLMPKDFKEMPQQQRQIKYPSSQRPEIIQTDETGSINIMLNRIDSSLNEDQVKELTDGMKAILKKVNPANIFFTDGVEKVDEKNVGYFEFKSPAMDGFIYNLMFFFEFEGKTVMGTFCCRYDEYKDWREVAFQVMKTIRVTKKNIEGRG
ncbi:hypothetical protein [Pseudobacteroides cellulosolvens]|uniref:Uncharacterized protein n=1 Tax=Pseudobacteroides cellulosolvens ATCC 35603 = DSM 2933 TaxID=398512 RepID=A0A0L6JQI2_9FIRM|nr:hypothetical protein [Pseudobacteroides cellulosolvens]KNY27950.1 hypothetical protein Bccel_3221 [Pseudobacteroides cellulosolvens ATCC 35603 = DSM 2933]